MKKLILILLFLGLLGCATSRGTKDIVQRKNIFYSNDSPNIIVQIPDYYSYQIGKEGELKHQLYSDERFILVDTIPVEGNLSQMDNNDNPASWMSSDNPPAERFNEGIVKKLEK